MTDLRQAAQQALEAWDSPLWKTGTTAAAIADLRAALEQQAEPVACGYDETTGNCTRELCCRSTQLEQQAEPGQWRDMVVVNLVREGVNKHKARELADHFATPPQRQWVGLTDEEIAECAERMEASDPTDSFWREFARAFEAKLKERNNG